MSQTVKFPVEYEDARVLLLKLIAKMVAAVISLTSEDLTKEDIYRNYRLDVRSIANIAIALMEIGENPYGHVKRCTEALESARDAGHWSDEVWDTSLALKALYFARRAGDKEVNISVLRKSIKWLCQMQREHHSGNERHLGGWHDEPWETALAVSALALLINSELNKKEFELKSRLKDAVDWLTSIQDKPSGMLLNPQYTALLLSSLIDSDMTISPEAQKAKEFLIQDGEKEVWLRESEEIWANCLSAIALMDARVEHDDPAIENCFSWLMDKKQQKEMLSTEYTDYEDVALAARFLYKYLISALVKSIGKDMEEPEKSKRAMRTFLRTSIAAAEKLEIEKAMRQQIPRVRRVREGIHIFIWNRDIMVIISAGGVLATILSILQLFRGG